MVADMAVKVETARMVIYKAAWLSDQGQALEARRAPLTRVLRWSERHVTWSASETCCL